MLINPQFIIKNKAPAFVVLPYEEYQNLLDSLEERGYIEEIKKFRDTTQKTYPLDLLQK